MPPSTTRANAARIRWTRCACPSLIFRVQAEVEALVTMLLGSTDPSSAPRYMYQPRITAATVRTAAGSSTEYRCIGCRRLTSTKNPVLMTLPMYQGETKPNLPRVSVPKARMWIRLAPPIPRQSLLGTADANGDGVRQYLQVRMPTSTCPTTKSVSSRYSSKRCRPPDPYIPPKVEPLRCQARRGSRLVGRPAAPCLKCHMTGDEAHDENASAPNFLLAPRKFPAGVDREMNNSTQQK